MNGGSIPSPRIMAKDDENWSENLSIEELLEKTRAAARRMPPRMAKLLEEACDRRSSEDIIAIIDAHRQNLLKKTS